MWTTDSRYLHTLSFEADPSLTRNALLRLIDERLDVSHNRVEYLTLVQHFPVKVGQVILPEPLPVRRRDLLELRVGSDQDNRGTGFEGNAPLDTSDRVADVNTPADAVLSTQSADLRNKLHAAERFAIESDGEALRELDRHVRTSLTRSPTRGLLVNFRRDLGPRIMGLLAANRGTPKPRVD